MSKQNGLHCQRCGGNTGKVFDYPTLCKECITKHKLSQQEKRRKKVKKEDKGFFGRLK